MCEPVNFLPLNYVEKDSESTPVRPVSNGSYNNELCIYKFCNWELGFAFHSYKFYVEDIII